jgi:hypothetical protein
MIKDKELTTDETEWPYLLAPLEDEDWFNQLIKNIHGIYPDGSISVQQLEGSVLEKAKENFLIKAVELLGVGDLRFITQNC